MRVYIYTHTHTDTPAHLLGGGGGSSSSGPLPEAICSQSQCHYYHWNYQDSTSHILLSYSFRRWYFPHLSVDLCSLSTTPVSGWLISQSSVWNLTSHLSPELSLLWWCLHQESETSKDSRWGTIAQATTRVLLAVVDSLDGVPLWIGSHDQGLSAFLWTFF